MFKGILIRNDNGYTAELATLDDAQLPEGNVTVAISHSTINYKDGLAITGKSPVVRQFPMVPGIDFAGEVTESRDSRYAPGDKVILNGWAVGEKYWGGLAQKGRFNADWLVPMPEKLTPRQAMTVGTAGYTAMLCVMALEKGGLKPGAGKILVTGANGGVGSFAVAFLSRLGYAVIASTGRPEESDYLKKLGAGEIIHRDELNSPGKPLMKERWAGAVDSLGGVTLANVCASTAYGGIVAACGLAQSMDFPASVAPFILRGVTLAGIDSVMRPYADRVAAWEKIAGLADDALFGEIGSEISLEEAIPTATAILAGKVRGRVVVDVNR